MIAAVPIRMRAIVQHRYGSPGLLELAVVDAPIPDDDSLLVRVRASSVNALDWYLVTGPPLLFRIPDGFRQPKNEVVGTDFSGTVESVGRNVKRFQPGDRVFGVKHGAFAEFVTVREDGPVAICPRDLSFEEAAALPVAGLTGLQAVRDHARLRPGRRVLINGAAGGVGTCTVQLAKAYGAEVTAVCSTANVALVSSLGAARVVDYTHQDFGREGSMYDAMVDIAGNRRWSDCRRVLERSATYVMVGAPGNNRWLGPLSAIARQRLTSLGASQRFVFFAASTNQGDLAVLAELTQSGKLRSVVDRRYPLEEVSAALDYIGTRHAHAKVVISIG